jgi:nucleotide-binding universal stress UspA family protein
LYLLRKIYELEHSEGVVMIDRILVPLDGSRVAEQILPHLRRLLFRHDSEVILVRAAAPPPMENGLMVMTDAVLHGARDYLLKIKDLLAQQGARVKSVARLGSPVGVILDVAKEERATMLALATHGETGLKRLLAGSVAQALLLESPVPVLVLRPFWSYELLPSRGDEEDLRPIRKILLPLDETDDAELLLPPLVEVARLFDASVVLLHVEQRESRKAEDFDAQGAADEAHLSRYSQALQSKGIPTTSVMGKGKLSEEILLAMRAYEVDLIVMATHGKSGLLRLLSGSVTESVLHESTCPILVVRAPATRGGKKETGKRRRGRKVRVK